MMWLLVVPLLAVVLLLAAAFRGAALAKALQDRSYAKAEVAARARADAIHTDDLLRTAALREARDAQHARQQQQARELNRWALDFRNLCMQLDVPMYTTPRGPLPGSRATAHHVTKGMVGVQWPEYVYPGDWEQVMQ